MTMQRRAFLSLLPAAGLSACGNMLGPPHAGTIYVMKPRFTAPAAPSAAAPLPKAAWALSVMRPDCPGSLDTDRIALIKPDGTMDYYANAAYPDRLPQLVQTALIDAIEAGGRIGQVAREQDALHADYALFTEIKDFEAHYVGAAPEVRVTLAAKLATSHGRIIVANMVASHTVPAGADSVGAVTGALESGLGAAASEIAAWVGGFPPPPTP
jgi:cholesterol transport system auxiliary component